MRDYITFSNNVHTMFENNEQNVRDFVTLATDASARVYETYNEKETQKVLRSGFERILHVANFKELTPMKRRQAWRDFGRDTYTLIEDVILDKMVSGWNTANARFMEFVRDVNLANGDKNEFFVEDNSLLTVSVFSGNHHDIVRQALKPGKAFSIDTSWYTIKVYTDFETFMLGKIDFAEMVDRMYKSIEQYRFSALYEAFMSLDSSLPTDMILDTATAQEVKSEIVEQIEAVKAVTGKDVILVGTRVAVQKLQDLVPYQMWSNGMKDEKNQKGLLGMWEGYECLALDRVNKQGTRNSIFTDADNKKIFILPVDPEFKPIIRVNEGDVMYYESGMDGMKKDMTIDAEIHYKEGIGVVINQLFGEILLSE